MLPISIDGLQFTRLGRMKGKLPMRWFPRLAVTIMPPVDLSPDPALKLDRHQRREAIGRALQDLLVETVFRAKQTDRTLFSALLDARAKHGGGIAIAEDLAREPISYNRVRARRLRPWTQARGARRSRANASACCCRTRTARS